MVLFKNRKEMNNNIFFSIIIPAYKQNFLKECIDSIFAQTYNNFELIIVDDASPDDLDSIVNSYIDERIKYYKNKKNCGALNVVDNWNICLSYATGDYVICMGDDDKLLPNCLEEYNKLIKKYPGKGIYHARTEIIDENSQLVRMQDARPIEEDVYSLIWNRWHGREQFIGDFLFETERLKTNGGFYKLPLAWGSDDITAVIAAKENGVINSQVPIFQYRINSHTISNSGNFELKLKAINKEEDWYNHFLSKPCNDEIHLKENREKTKNELTRFMNKKRSVILMKDFSQNNWINRLKYWILNKEIYRLNINIIIYSMIKSIKIKIFSHEKSCLFNFIII